MLGFPAPAWIAVIAYVYGSVVLNYTSFGRYVLAVGGNEEAARLMGLPVDRVMFWTYVQSGVFASLAGVILAAQFGAGQPAEGVGWELFSIAAVVVGGTLLTGGVGSVADDAWPASCCSASSSTCSISRTASAGSASAPIGSRWCAASSSWSW